MAITFTKSTSNPNTRYVQGGETDIFQNRLGWWERREIVQDDNDVRFVLESQHEGRPDIIAYEQWGKPKLAWLVLQYNTILDPTTELVKGKTIRLPSEVRVTTEILTQGTGGNNRTRIS